MWPLDVSPKEPRQLNRPLSCGAMAACAHEVVYCGMCAHCGASVDTSSFLRPGPELKAFESFVFARIRDHEGAEGEEKR